MTCHTFKHRRLINRVCSVVLFRRCEMVVGIFPRAEFGHADSSLEHTYVSRGYG